MKAAASSLMDAAFVRTIILIAIAVVGATFGDALLSIGMRRIGELGSADWRAMLAYFWRAFTSPWVMGGIGCLAIYFFVWLMVLSEADLSLALPMTALTFVLAAFLARFWLGETVTAIRWIGTAVIAIGVVMVAWSGVHKVSSVPLRPATHDTQPTVVER